MISKKTKSFCCEDISLIENYDIALKSDELYVCHHKNGILLNKSKQELIDLNLYYNRPANELILLTNSEHSRIHGLNMNDYNKEIRKKSNIGQKLSTEFCKNRSELSKKMWQNEHYHNPTSTGKHWKLSDEQKQNMSESKKGDKNPRFGKPSTIKGKHKVWDDETHTHFHYE